MALVQCSWCGTLYNKKLIGDKGFCSSRFNTLWDKEFVDANNEGRSFKTQLTRNVEELEAEKAAESAAETKGFAFNRQGGLSVIDDKRGFVEFLNSIFTKGEKLWLIVNPRFWRRIAPKVPMQQDALLAGRVAVTQVVTANAARPDFLGLKFWEPLIK
ncbi:hypothetical protein LQZ19_16755 [Treponema primitia]|uniref:hypothetical protein n=1 Tax=Treponema primitia TaxID=88058 RepID=UPI00397EF813